MWTAKNRQIRRFFCLTILCFVPFGFLVFPNVIQFLYLETFVYSIEIYKIDSLSSTEWVLDVFHLEIFHDQLPLAVPCYDLVLVIEFTLVPRKVSLWVLPTSLT